MDNGKSILPQDRISDFPINVVETILMYLPTHDAARTSILSRSWRHVFSKLPQFVLDKKFWASVPKQSSAEIALVKILYPLLLRHDGPITKFTLSNPKLSSCPEIDNLIFFLTKSHLEDFTLEMWDDCYLVPHSLFSCQKLRDLSLRLCSIRSSPAYEGFSMLTTLKLFEVTVSAETLASLISGSPLLGYLEIERCSEVDICIDAPNLKTFILYGYTKSINFKRVPLLAVVSITQDCTTEGTIIFESAGYDNVNLFPVIESLELSYEVLPEFVLLLQRMSLPYPLIYLKDLSLDDISFTDIDDLSLTLYLLKISPNLKFIDIMFQDYEDSNSENTTTYMEWEDQSYIYLSELLEVNLEGIKGTKLELEFIRFLLAKSPRLEKIQIQPQASGFYSGFNILKEVTKFRRISKEAEIIFEES